MQIESVYFIHKQCLYLLSDVCLTWCLKLALENVLCIVTLPLLNTSPFMSPQQEAGILQLSFKIEYRMDMILVQC